MKKIIAIITSLAMSIPLTATFAATYKTETFLSKIDGGMGKVATEAYVDEPLGMAMGDGDIYLVDTSNNVIEKIDDKTQRLIRVAGTGEYGYKDGAAASAQFATPADLAVRGNGKKIYVSDTANNRVRLIENGQVSTWLDGLRSPQGVTLSGSTLFISDTGNNKILATNTDSRTQITLADSGDGINTPTKLQYCGAVDKLIFANFGEGTVRALNTKTGEVSAPLIRDLEEIGGIYCAGRTLYISSSYSIGVFNEIWKLRLNEAGTAAVSTKKLSSVRETEHLNASSDILLRQDTLNWEEYYTWEPNLLYGTSTNESTDADEETISKKEAKKIKTQQKKRQAQLRRRTKSALVCLPTRKQGEENWRTQWLLDVDTKTDWQTQDFIARSEYQGDFPYFRVKLVYDDKDLSAEERAELREANQTEWVKGNLIAATSAPEILSEDVDETIPIPQNLTLTVRGARQATLAWDAVSGATKYQVQLYEGNARIYSAKNVTATQLAIKKIYLKSNSAYSFKARVCVNNNCGAWSDLYAFRTIPPKVSEIEGIRPARGSNITKLENGDYRLTLRYRLPQNQKRNPRNNLRAQVQLCSKNRDHAKGLTVDRLYVLYKGGSSVLAWRANGKLPQHYVGKHRFQDDYGQKARALVGRPKALVFSADGNKMYISQNNQFTVYDFTSKKLTHLAGHLMDNYVEGTGDTVRISDVTAMAISPDDKWIYFVDRNNHRIRKINTRTATTKYITGAGGTNYSFESLDGNGYQEGGPCANVMESNKKGCAYFNRPTGLALSPDGETLYVAEGSNNRIRSVNVDNGQTKLIAGSGEVGFKDGVGDAAQFNGPYTLDVSADGATLYVADKYNHAIRKIDLATKAVTTVVGNGTIGLRDGSFTDARLAIPEYLAEENGTLYWTEAGSSTVRAASLGSKTVWTVSGNGQSGYADGDGKNAKWRGPKGFDFRGGKMYVSDYSNDLIRVIDLTK